MAMATVTGTGANDVLSGTGNSDVVDGLGGVDRFVFAGDYADVRTMRMGNDFRVNARATGEGIDLIRNVERIDFGDGVRLQVAIEPQDIMITRALDTGNAYTWNDVRTALDADNRVQWQRTEHDGGSVTFNDYAYHANGELAQRVIIDGAEGTDGIARWARLLTTYNEDGSIAGSETTFDDGTVRTQAFDYDQWGGIVQRVILDGEVDPSGSVAPGTGRAAWTSIVTLFDDSGRQVSQLTEYDNGTYGTRTLDYDPISGDLAAKTQVDGRAVGANSDIIDGRHEYETITTFFDEDGNKERVETRYDDGTAQTSNYVHMNGQLLFVGHYDGEYDQDTGTWVNGRKTWDEIATLYDPSGNVAEVRSTMDNDDVRTTFYEAGEVVARVYEDLSNTRDAWDVRIDIYADGGVTTTYDDWSVL